jgi:lipoate-protein ligase A
MQPMASRLVVDTFEHTESENGGDSMHGEYKLPGGKLVRVDAEAENGRLRDVMVSGDFFLYPEEALEAITGALHGVSVSESEQGIASLVRDAIPAGTEWLGSSPEALAIAVRRAIEPDGAGER